MKNSRLLLTFVFILFLFPGLFNIVKAQYFVQEFDDVANIPGWIIKNNSFPTGSITWFQGNTVDVFAEHSGSGYIAVNSLSTSDPGNNGTISNWLISPPLVFSNGDVITFYTRKTDGTVHYADRMQVRISLAGSSSNAGVTAQAVGDFTFVLKDINPTYSNDGFPTGYPYSWTRYDLTISSLTSPTQGRFAFRYFVELAGATGRGDYIGVDSVAFHPALVGIGDVVAPLDFSIYPNPVKDVMYIECNSNIHSVKVTDILGNTIENIGTETGKVQLNTATYRAGIYFVTAQTNKGIVTRKISIVK